MPAAVPTRRSSLRRPRRGTATRFDRKLGKILAHASEVFCDKGYEGASMRDLSRASGVSLAGLYYYFESKEKLLYLIQKTTFTTIVERLRERLEGLRDPEARVRALIHNHLEYFLANKKAMKVLSHESEALKNSYGAEIAAIKREYYKMCLHVVEELLATRGRRSEAESGAARGGGLQPRIAVLSLFGMMNWIYTWHKPRVDADAGALAEQMSEIFLRGVLNGAPAKHSKARSSRA